MKYRTYERNGKKLKIESGLIRTINNPGDLYYRVYIDAADNTVWSRCYADCNSYDAYHDADVRTIIIVRPACWGDRDRYTVDDIFDAAYLQ